MLELCIDLSFLGIFGKFKRIKFSNLNVKVDIALWYSRQIKPILLERIETSRLQVLILPHLLILRISLGPAFKIIVRIKDNIKPWQMPYRN
jgi:hypothetical protein